MKPRRTILAVVGIWGVGAGIWGSGMRAQPAAPRTPEGSGLVIQARPWRAPDRQVNVDYTVRLEGVPATPGMLLAAYRQTRLGRFEGLPLTRVGWLRVVAASEQTAVARAVPGRPPEGPNPGSPVVQVGDQLRLEASLEALGAAGSSMELARIFAAGGAELSPDADRALAELVKPLGATSGPVLVAVKSGGIGSAGDSDVAFGQANLLARQVARLLKLETASVHAVTLPVSGSEGSARVELRVLPQEDVATTSKRAGAK